MEGESEGRITWTYHDSDDEADVTKDDSDSDYDYEQIFSSLNQRKADTTIPPNSSSTTDSLPRKRLSSEGRRLSRVDVRGYIQIGLKDLALEERSLPNTSEAVPVAKSLGTDMRSGSLPPKSVSFLIPNLLADDVIDATLKPKKFSVTGKIMPRKVGYAVRVNDKDVAVFRYKKLLYATDNKCPHMGGPLADGDIEDLADDIVVKCPYHGYKFSLGNGTRRFPPCAAGAGADCSDNIHTYPVRADEAGRLWIFFESLSQSVFGCTDF
eukprot:GILJ01005669.1.p1 GENE.GILJ01005669.1~~GILJ01005669.1.p1  ORF type:complete len:267 (+),score=32.67 GILJ01005669.1:47-847(+)